MIHERGCEVVKIQNILFHKNNSAFDSFLGLGVVVAATGEGVDDVLEHVFFLRSCSLALGKARHFARVNNASDSDLPCESIDLLVRSYPIFL
ncbi:hypothetical protein L6164_010511 [Bauhinia variegata]|uniref:Uncharacterized protein n=1 Tax=Bauhinia variegata TaxID=167791 RepID=A0ACB9PN23_BAUVA|nr:hypothetical protein L6164_010511 [Bauhinia variegata]